jgi:hypothetical protein
MTLITLCGISAALLVLVSIANWRLGFFDSGSMGVGLVFAIGMYVIFWFGGTALATLVAFALHHFQG